MCSKHKASIYTAGDWLMSDVKMHKLRLTALAKQSSIPKSRLKEYIKYSIALTDKEFAALDKAFNVPVGYRRALHRALTKNNIKY